MRIIDTIRKYKGIIEVTIIILSFISVINYSYHWWETENNIVNETQNIINNEAIAFFSFLIYYNSC